VVKMLLLKFLLKRKIIQGSFRIKTAVIKKGAKHKGSAVPYVISSDGSSSSEEIEEDDEGSAEQERNRSDTEEETPSEES